MFFADVYKQNIYSVQGFSQGTLTVSSGNGQSAIVNTQFATPLTVTLKDPYGSPISGETVTFAAPGSGATAALSASSVVTAADGTATVTATANGTAGSYAVTATLYGFSGAFSLTNAINIPIQSVTLPPHLPAEPRSR
jgi:hypothetical protein